MNFFSPPAGETNYVEEFWTGCNVLSSVGTSSLGGKKCSEEEEKGGLLWLLECKRSYNNILTFLLLTFAWTGGIQVDHVTAIVRLYFFINLTLNSVEEKARP